MKTTIITTPSEAIAALRSYFVRNSVTAFDESSTLRLSFRARVNGSVIAVTAVAEPPIPRLVLLTRILCPIGDAVDGPAEFCNFLNLRCTFASSFISDDPREFTFESVLHLGDGMCLAAQLTTFADGHMAAVSRLAPLLEAFAQQRIGRREAEAWLCPTETATEDSPVLKELERDQERASKPGRN
ncbi:hypothetical protein K0B96_10815 [Horticoccus luteus]|uniref:Sensory transduction regulator n=1 Tax=Horticoccus luteus TaxID=2862869 RepID=A0A8F9XF82_9BACT|nr:hypothetical protein [Horticoccus luteus]QYM77812.1 hypothetical protein K0B96_10815 [Horticoccus luteus]